MLRIKPIERLNSLQQKPAVWYVKRELPTLKTDKILSRTALRELRLCVVWIVYFLEVCQYVTGIG